MLIFCTPNGEWLFQIYSEIITTVCLITYYSMAFYIFFHLNKVSIPVKSLFKHHHTKNKIKKSTSFSKAISFYFNVI